MVVHVRKESPVVGSRAVLLDAAGQTHLSERLHVLAESYHRGGLPQDSGQRREAAPWRSRTPVHRHQAVGTCSWRQCQGGAAPRCAMPAAKQLGVRTQRGFGIWGEDDDSGDHGPTGGPTGEIGWVDFGSGGNDQLMLRAHMAARHTSGPATYWWGPSDNHNPNPRGGFIFWELRVLRYF